MDGRELTYESLDERAAAFAGELHEHGVDPDDRLLLYLPNCPEYVVVLLGAFRAGVVVSPSIHSTRRGNSLINSKIRKTASQ